MSVDALRQHSAELPIWSAWPALRQALQEHARVVLTAPPGAGKSSVLPLALLQHPVAGAGSILLLEPRRLAARMLARRMADLLGESVGQTVGLRSRDETRVGPDTRIEVLTEALLTRRLQQDPELPGVSLIIFDEFHERSVHADLGLALAREVQDSLREDLRLLVMSATLDEGGLAAALDATTVTAAGRSYPVDVHYRPARAEQEVVTATAAAVRGVLREQPGSVLAFLPGEREIAGVAERLAGIAASVHPLFGRLDRAAQDAAIAPAPEGQRKVVLATNVAETSLTIEGIRVVVDSGLSRNMVFDPNAGFGRLQTGMISRDAADQRAGRAGRTAPGICLRLWASDRVLQPMREPEIKQADLAPLALNVAAWGSEPAWLTPPPPGAWAQAQDLLSMLGLLDAGGRITAAGRQVLQWGAHPRVGCVLLAGQQRDALPMACDLAALLEADSRRRRGWDLQQQWLDWRRGKGRDASLQRESRRWRQRLGVGDAVVETDPAPLLAVGFPERVAQRREDAGGRYVLRNGRGATLDDAAAPECLVVALLDGAGEAKIRQAVPYARADLESQFAAVIETDIATRFDAGSGLIRATAQRRLGAIVLDAQGTTPAPDDRLRCWLDVLPGRLPGLLAAPRLQRLLGRLRWLGQNKADWPDFTDAALANTLDQWLAAWLLDVTRLAQLDEARLEQALLGRLDGGQRQQLQAEAPEQLSLPGGGTHRLEYGEDGPVLAVRLQQLLGCAHTPQLAGKPVLLHLLSPARRPLAVTRDLASFWVNAYPEVRKQMRGRYPKHAWPADPLSGV